MPKALLIDTNLLVLWVLGAASLEHVERFHRTRQFTAQDYYLLMDIAAPYEIVVTPHILAETSNLLGQLGEPLRRVCFAELASMVPGWRERQPLATEIVDEPVYLRLGITDSAVYQLAKNRITVLTDDLDLYLAAAADGLDSINFTHRRAERDLV